MHLYHAKRRGFSHDEARPRPRGACRRVGTPAPTTRRTEARSANQATHWNALLPKGIEGYPKGTPQDTEGYPKGTEGYPKGTEGYRRVPKGTKVDPRGHRRVPDHSQRPPLRRAKVHQKTPEGFTRGPGIVKDHKGRSAAGATGSHHRRANSTGAPSVPPWWTWPRRVPRGPEATPRVRKSPCSPY